MTKKVASKAVVKKVQKSKGIDSNEEIKILIKQNQQLEERVAELEQKKDEHMKYIWHIGERLTQLENYHKDYVNRFEKHGFRINELENDNTNFHQWFDNHVKSLRNMDKSLCKLDDRVSKLENRVNKLEKDNKDFHQWFFDNNVKSLCNMDNRVSKLEKDKQDVHQWLGNLEDDANIIIDEIKKIDDRMESTFNRIDEALNHYSSFDMMKTSMGEALTTQEVADLFKLNHKTVRKYSEDFGGIPLCDGRTYRFFSGWIAMNILKYRWKKPKKQSYKELQEVF